MVSTIYVQESLGQEELSKFMKGEHVMHHVPGLWNGICSDVFIETTFMHYGHGPGGIIGITLEPETLKTWALGLHICSRLEQDIISLVGKEQDISQEAHKDEMKARIASDGAERQSIQDKLKLCIDLLDPTSHPPTIVNILSGQVADDSKFSRRSSNWYQANASVRERLARRFPEYNRKESEDCFR